MTQNIYIVNTPKDPALVISIEEGRYFLVPTLFPWKRISVINHLIDWLSSYPKHDLKTEMKLAIYLHCRDILIKENAAL